MSSNNIKHLWPPQMENDFINLLLQYTGIPINWYSIRDEMKKITGRELSKNQLMDKYSKSLRADYENFSAVLMENGVGWECLVSHESWVEYMQKIPEQEQVQAFNKKGHQHYMLLHNLFNQKAAVTNSGQKPELDSIDSSESCKRVKDSVFSYEGPSLSVEAPSCSYDVTECINVLKTMGLDHNFYVDALSHLLKNLYHRVEFLATSENIGQGYLATILIRLMKMTQGIRRIPPIDLHDYRAWYKTGLLSHYIDKANENDPRNKENPTNRPP